MSGARDEVESVIEQHLRPLVEADGGTIELVELEGKRVVLRLEGTCAGCPGKPFTLAGVLEPALRRVLGEDAEVVTV